MPAHRPEGPRGALVRWMIDQHPGTLFLLADAARDDAVLPTLLRAGVEHRSLYEGWQGEGLSEVAPYLAAVPREGPFLDAWVDASWGASWGTFLFSDVTIFELRRHLRRFLKVRSEDGKTLLFRFYDPRVLRAYLPTCTPAETEAFLGPVRWWICEGPRGAALMRFHATPEGLGCDSEALPDAPADD